MNKGMSLHIGMEKFDKEYYGTEGKLSTCQKDSEDMHKIALSQNFQELKILLNTSATRDAVKQEILLASEKLESGDLFFITYSGHGSYIKNMDGTEKDKRDEVWCLYDGMLLDDELRQLWTLFKEGVRVFVISDSCHSGTIIKGIFSNDTVTSKQFSAEKSQSIYLDHKEFYDEVKENTRESKAVEIMATVLLISGCQDKQSSYILPHAVNSVLTTEINVVWNDGKFEETTVEFFEKIKENVKVITEENQFLQAPNWLVIGKDKSAFRLEKPFKI